MTAISPTIIFMILVSGAAQLLALSLLPLTRGFTQPWPTLVVCTSLLLGVGVLARVANSGVNISILVPILAAVVPIGTIIVGVFAYGEAASLARISVLILACMLIGLANLL